ncbi:hypothetical protein PoB_006451100 [Plakobranchus ocellatus]|uniref:Uncharacterized protein n=1 Tax=Plakobranchus ocellatus TaxID=259542 RepID=A0AAV4D1D6_9GAST|nr:hypothetical protein PoB_006451100 [Plakobranchus ocellatus]
MELGSHAHPEKLQTGIINAARADDTISLAEDIDSTINWYDEKTLSCAGVEPASSYECSMTKDDKGYTSKYHNIPAKWGKD